MNWTPDELVALCAVMDDGPIAIATRAVGLVAARGGTMTAEELDAARYAVSSGDSLEADFTDHWGAKVFEHIATQGVTVATLQAEVERLSPLEHEVKRLRVESADAEASAKRHLQEAEAIRKDLADEKSLHEATHQELERFEQEAESLRARATESERKLELEHALRMTRQADADSAHAGKYAAMRECDTLRAEVERLKAEVEQEKDLHRRTLGELDSAHAECETLREETRRADAAAMHEIADSLSAESRLAAVTEALKDMAAEDDADAPMPSEFKAGWHAAVRHMKELLGVAEDER